MWAVVATAKQFSVRPSELLAIDDPVVALMVDLEAGRMLMELKQADGEHREQVCL